METIEKRLQALRGQDRTEPCRPIGLLNLAAGQRPIDALAATKPGLWFLTHDAGNAGFLGRVSSSGKRVILFGGADHADH